MWTLPVAAPPAGRTRSKLPPRCGRIAAHHAGQHVDLAHELRRPPLRRLGVHVLGRADLHDPALAHQRQPIGQGQSLLLVVRNQNRGGAGIAQDQLDLPPEVGAQRRIEAREGLVEKDHLGLGSERAGQRDTLALAAGELVRMAVRLVLQAHELERAQRPVTIAAPAAEGDVALDREVREQRVVLEDHPDPAPLGRDPAAVPRDRSPAHGDAPDSGRSNPAMRRSSVVFPHPDGPSTANSSPGCTASVTLVDGAREPEALRDVVELDTHAGRVAPRY